ncbi:hypothetical protein [Clostridium sp.]|uniref:hypothetical protein n=1 Tax=Clostridium sp. TaxID=1506 RepID=UPI0028400BFE|nr:hypothetical protein [Clostridium sp.]MDR3597415.1 hypothetical protein [Clostridium sp.]
MENPEQINQQFTELKEKYESLIQRLDNIEKESTNRENDFQAINNNIKELMAKIDSMVEYKETSKLFNSGRKSSSSFMNMITTPMRKITVGTMRTIFSMADYASERVSCAREGIEDIVAEAQYENKKRRSTMMPSAQS